MRVGSLVQAKWQEGLLGVVVSCYRTDYGELIWNVKWATQTEIFSQSSEFEVDLILLCK